VGGVESRKCWSFLSRQEKRKILLSYLRGKKKRTNLPLKLEGGEGDKMIDTTTREREKKAPPVFQGRRGNFHNYKKKKEKKELKTGGGRGMGRRLIKKLQHPILDPRGRGFR